MVSTAQRQVEIEAVDVVTTGEWSKCRRNDRSTEMMLEEGEESLQINVQSSMVVISGVVPGSLRLESRR